MNEIDIPKKDMTENMNAEDYFCYLLRKGYSRELVILFVGRRFSRQIAENINKMVL